LGYGEITAYLEAVAAVQCGEFLAKNPRFFRLFPCAGQLIQAKRPIIIGFAQFPRERYLQSGLKTLILQCSVGLAVILLAHRCLLLGIRQAPNTKNVEKYEQKSVGRSNRICPHLKVIFIT
jgi:hypothetical protein